MKKILIVYEKAGCGHLKTARALEAVLAGQGVVITLATPFEIQGLSFENFFATVFLKWLRKLDCPWLVDFLFDYIQKIFLQPWLIAFGLKRFKKVILNKYQPDIIISTISGINNTLAYCAEQCGASFYVFITDISVYADILVKNAVHLCYFPETVEAVKSFPPETFCVQPIEKYKSFLGRCFYPWGYIFHHGIRLTAFYRSVGCEYLPVNDLKCHSLGIFREQKFFKSASEDKLGLRERLGIARDKPCVIISGGGLGGGFIKKTLMQLLSKYENDLTIIALCGTDAKLLSEIELFKGENKSKIAICPLGFIDNLNEYLRTADVIISRGTTGMFLEAVICKTPLLVRKKVEKHDRGISEIINKYSLGAIYDKPEELLTQLPNVLQKQNIFIEKIEKFIDLTASKDYDNIAKKIRGIIMRNEGDK